MVPAFSSSFLTLREVHCRRSPRTPVCSAVSSSVLGPGPRLLGISLSVASPAFSVTPVFIVHTSRSVRSHRAWSTQEWCRPYRSIMSSGSLRYSVTLSDISRRVPDPASSVQECAPVLLDCLPRLPRPRLTLREISLSVASYRLMVVPASGAVGKCSSVLLRISLSVAGPRLQCR